MKIHELIKDLEIMQDEGATDVGIFVSDSLFSVRPIDHVGIDRVTSTAVLYDTETAGASHGLV